jgi:ABC-type multidrug transport system ATPase subunit
MAIAKTTLVRSLLGFIQPTTGTVSIDHKRAPPALREAMTAATQKVVLCDCNSAHYNRKRVMEIFYYEYC